MNNSYPASILPFCSLQLPLSQSQAALASLFVNMEIKRSSFSNPYGSAAATFEEHLMQQKLLFSANLKELKSLRKQLYTAAEQFEVSYSNEVQKDIVTDNCKDYTIKALINTIDHLGSVAYKVNSFLEQTTSEVAAEQLRLYSLEQRGKTWQHYINRGGMYQQSLAFKAPRHHTHYIIPEESKEAAEWEVESVVTTGEDEAHSRSSSSIESNFHRFANAVQKTTSGSSPSSFQREVRSQLRYTQGYSRQPTSAFSWNSTTTTTTTNKKREDSPQRYPLLLRSGSLYLKRSISASHDNGKQRNPSALVSWLDGGRGRGVSENEVQSSKSKRLLFRAMVRMRGSRKDNGSIIYKKLDEI